MLGYQGEPTFLMIVLLIILIARFGEPWKSSDHTRHCDQPKRVGRTQADAVLGGLFPMHALSNGADKRYFDLNLGAVTWVEAMIFALNEINNNTDLLKNFTLGFDIRDTCNEVSKALAASLDFVLDLPSVNTTKVYTNSTGFKYQANATEPQGSFCKCVNSTPLILAVIGGAASPISTNVATIFGVDRIPQISYSSTSALLSDKQVYPSFLRTIPSDLYQAKAIADLLQSFGWNYVSVIASDNAYGRSGMDALRLELKARGICIAVEAIFYPSLIKEKLHQIIDLLKRKPRASVVVLWCQRPNAVGFLQEATKHDLRNKTWIGTETWGDAYQIQELSKDTVAGMIGIVPRLETHKEFERHLALLNPQNSAHNPWMKEFWEGEFDCVWQTNKTLNFKSINSQVTKDRYYQYYTQSEPTLVSENVTILCPKVNGVPSTSRLPRNKYTNVMNAVYAVAHGIENLLKCTHGNGLLDDAKCPQVDPFIKPEELLIYIRNVSFSGKSGSQVMFTSDGDPVFGSYAIKNLQQNAETGKMEFVEIGLWSGSERKLSLFTNTPIQWNGGTAIPPNSTCEDICPPGKYVVNGSISCCWTCVPCIQGFVKPRRGHFPCVRCPDGYDSNGEGTFCIKLSEDYLHLASTWGVVIPVLSTLGIFMTCFLFAVFIKNRRTAVVKASNRELSFIHLASILAIFTLPLTKIGKPTVASCALSPFYFSITFTICTSIMLLKTDRLLRIFHSRSRLTESGSKLLTNKVQVMTALGLTCIPVGMTTIWLIIKPPAVDVITEEISEKKLIYQCGETTDALHITLLVFVLFLALVCTYFAYRARKLPENFNEAKFIGFAMFGFCLCWLAFIPAFYDTKGANKELIFSTTVFVSGFCVLSIMYFPKLRFILCFPEQNRPEVFRANIILTNISASSATSPTVDGLVSRSSLVPGSPSLGMERAKHNMQSAVSFGSLTIPTD